MSEALNIKLTKASAGSGKTYSLMGKIADLVNGNTDPASILATTFTVKAANELKERIRGKLLEMGQEELAQKVSTGLIGTVNGICGRLLSEYAIEAGLSPQLDVLSDTNSRVIFQRAVAAAIKDDIVAFEPLAYRMTMLEEQCKTMDTEGNDWWTQLIRMCDIARANGLGEKELEEDEKHSLAAVDDLYAGGADFTLDNVLPIVESQMPLIEKIADEDSPEHELASDGAIDFCTRIVNFKRERTWKNALPPSRPPANKKDSPAAYGDILKPLYEELRASVLTSNQLKADARLMVTSMFKMAKSCLNAYQDFKKRYGLIDFVDQEMRLLDLFENNEGFRAAFKERVKVIMVDEFQDTSPMQLALFLKMNELVGNSVWVGDPKQAIYGFRGTDPVLMASVADGIEKANPDNIDTLKYSWRSRENLVNFSNAVFGESFKGTMKGQDIVLGIDWEQVRANGDEDKRTGGEIESWVINQRAGVGYATLLAEAINSYLLAHEDRPFREIAVLTRTNAEASEVAEALGELGIPASAASGFLNQQPICSLAMSAYRYAVDKKDTMALATLVAYVMDDEEWFSHLVGGRFEDASDPEKIRVRNRTLDEWADDPRIKVLDVNETRTPLELMDFVIGAFALDDYAGRMCDPDRSLRNLEALRSLCTKFTTEAKLGGYPVTHAGFINYYDCSEDPEASCVGGDCIQVLTYHKSKGLEWPVVILTALHKDASANPFDLGVEQVSPFDASKPLAGRELRAVFNAFGRKNVSAFKDTKEYRRVMPDATLRDLEERKRLMYVGITRARDVLVLAPQLNSRTKAPTVDAKWLDSLTKTEALVKAEFAEPPPGKKTVKKPVVPSLFAGNWRLTNEDASEWQIEDKQFTVLSRYYDPTPTAEPEVQEETPDEGVPPADEGRWSDALCENPPTHIEASRAPSADEGTSVPVKVTATVEMGKWISVRKEDEESDLLGNAMHGYYAVALKDEDDPGLAEALLKNWNVSHIVSPADLVETGSRLRRYIRSKWPEGEILTEVPMTFVNEKGQRYQGSIDMLVKVGNDYVLIDHKTGSNRKFQAVAEQYAGQQIIYKKAIEQSLGGKVLTTVLHLPVCGVCLECEL